MDENAKNEKMLDLIRLNRRIAEKVYGKLYIPPDEVWHREFVASHGRAHDPVVPLNFAARYTFQETGTGIKTWQNSDSGEWQGRDWARSISQAWELVERYRAKGYEWTLTTSAGEYKPYFVHVARDGRNFTASAGTMPVAICKVALQIAEQENE